MFKDIRARFLAMLAGITAVTHAQKVSQGQKVIGKHHRGRIGTGHGASVNRSQRERSRRRSARRAAKGRR